MSCQLSAEDKLALETEKADLEAILVGMNAAIIKAAKSSYISNYELDTGPGKQKVAYRNIAEMRRGLIGFKSDLARINTLLKNAGVVDFVTDRFRGAQGIDGFN